MVWTQPKTWASEPLTSADLNTHLRDNLEALKDPPTDHYIFDESSDYVTTSTTFVDVDATNLALTIITGGGDVMVHFHGFCLTATTYWDVEVDGVRDGGNDGYTRAGGSQQLSFTRLITGLTAGSHTFKLQWKVLSGTATLYAGAGTASNDYHPQFWVREVS